MGVAVRIENIRAGYGRVAPLASGALPRPTGPPTGLRKSGICQADCRSADVLTGLSLSVGRGDLLALIGPNGCGKSTFLRAITGVLPLRSGEVFYNGERLGRLRKRPWELARQVAVVSQAAPALFDFTVQETVLMGRTPHLRRFQREGKRDLEITCEAMESTDVLHLADRPLSSLSGGEHQRVLIARALAQEPDVLLLDEPTTHLDISHQMDIYELLLRLNRERGLTVLCVSHDLNSAAEFFDRVALMEGGQISAVGDPVEIITPENLARAYGTQVPVVSNELSGRPHVLLTRSAPSAHDK